MKEGGTLPASMSSSLDSSWSSSGLYSDSSDARPVHLPTRDGRLYVVITRDRDTAGRDLACYSCALAFMVVFVGAMILFAEHHWGRVLRQDEPLVVNVENEDDVEGEAALREASKKHRTRRVHPVSRTESKPPLARTATRVVRKAVTVKAATLRRAPGPLRSARPQQSTKVVPNDDDDVIRLLEKLAREAGIQSDDNHSMPSKSAVGATNPEPSRIIIPTQQTPLAGMSSTSQETTTAKAAVTPPNQYFVTKTSSQSAVTSSFQSQSMIARPLIRIVLPMITAALPPGRYENMHGLEIPAASSLTPRTSAPIVTKMPTKCSSVSSAGRAEGGGGDHAAHLKPLATHFSLREKIWPGGRSPIVSWPKSSNSSAGVSFLGSDYYTVAYTEPFVDEAPNDTLSKEK
ncbi:uncharacterized protein LOC144108504 [Amblyomma americanum]